MKRASSQPPRELRPLETVTAVFDATGMLDTAHGKEALQSARDRVAGTIASGVPASSALILAPFAGGLLVELIATAEPGPEELRALAARLETAGVARLPLLREATREPALAALDPAAGRRVALSLLIACAPLRHVSAWSIAGVGEVSCSAALGPGAASRAARSLARATIAGESRPATPAGEMVAVALTRAGQPVGALVARSRRGATRAAAAYLSEARGPIEAILARESLLASNAASERILLAASERRLTRLGFDLHDGPLQELLLVGEDLALFRNQLAVVLEGRRGKELLGGRLDDLHARLVSLERGLRGISSAVHSDVLVTRPFGDALRDLLDPFVARTGIQPAVECRGDLESISTSQRLALLSVVGEALNNIREHAGATAVTLTIELGREGLTARICDNGRGFEIERELLRAARGGHMGLAGMHERVRLLDGHCRVESRPGGPTEVTLALPRWSGSTVAAAGAERARQR